nr:MFS transporter [Lentilactobacillus rapi]
MLGLLIFVLPELEIGQREHFSFIKTYTKVFNNKRAISYLFAYFVFQTGSFTVMTFISTWFTKGFGLTLAGVGTAMIAIGGGNLVGSLFGSRIVDWLGLEKSFLYELLALIALYLVIPFVHIFWLAEVLLTIAFLVNGFIFPLFMTTLQSTAKDARSTISSLSNAAMYFGETIAGIIGGILFNQFNGFAAISLFAFLMIGISIILYGGSGIFKRRRQLNL